MKATEQPVGHEHRCGQGVPDMLGVFAEFETNLRRERQLDGIAAAKARGFYAGKGRRRSTGVERVLALRAEGMGPAQIAWARHDRSTKCSAGMLGVCSGLIGSIYQPDGNLRHPSSAAASNRAGLCRQAAKGFPQPPLICAAACGKRRP